MPFASSGATDLTNREGFVRLSHVDRSTSTLVLVLFSALSYFSSAFGSGGKRHEPFHLPLRAK